jgi:SAM-dependent methyltransferase
MHLDLGAGEQYHNPFGAKLLYAVDILPEKPISFEKIHYTQADLTNSLPYEANTFDSISCYDVLEHIPRWERQKNGKISFPFINLMSEIHRILKPGGYFYGYTPAYPNPAAFQDPTHINIISEETVTYFVQPHPFASSYGFAGSFELVQQSWMRGVGPTTTKLPLPGFHSKENLIDLIRFFIRTCRVLKNRNPSHLLWVLRKPTRVD